MGALLVLALIMLLEAYNPERSRLDGVVAQLATGASADARPLFMEAGEVVHNLLSRFPNHGPTLDAVARFYQRVGNSKDAIRCWQRCMELDPASAAASHAAIASLAFEKGEFETAAEHFRLAMQLEPASSAYPVHLGETLISQGKPEEAVRVLQENLNAHPRSMPTSVLLGQAYLRLRQYDKARYYLEKGAGTDPDYPTAYHGLATACAQLGDQEKARQYLEKFKELQARKERRHRQVLKTSDDVARVRETAAATYTDAARVYLAQGDLPTAGACLVRAIELAPNAAEARLLLADLYEQQGRLQETLATLAEASQRVPHELSTQLSLASAYSRLGRFEEAEAAYRKVIELAPHQASSHAALAQFYVQARQKLPDAKTLAQKAVELDPAPDYWFLLCQACLGSGDRAGALAAIGRAVALDSGNAQFRQLHEQLRDKR